MGDLENPGQHPVHEELEGTDDSVLEIFEISSVFILLRSKNPLLTFPLSYYVWVTSKIQGQPPVQEVLGGTDNSVL